MFNKKTKIIVFTVIISLLAIVLLLMFKINNEGGIVSEVDEATKEKIVQLRNSHPEYSASQLKFYSEIAKRDEAILIPCEGRKDEDVCISSVAFIKGRSDICGHIEDIAAKIKCVEPILQEEIDKCFSLNGDNFINCLISLFSIYGNETNCYKLKSKKAQEICESTFYYEDAFVQYDKNLCSKVKNEKLNQYCLDNIREEEF